MKINYSKIILPLGVILLALIGSFLTYANEKGKQQMIVGYITTDPNEPCSISIQCGNISNTICTVVYLGQIYQASGKISPSDTACPLFLKRYQ